MIVPCLAAGMTMFVPIASPRLRALSAPGRRAHRSHASGDAEMLIDLLDLELQSLPPLGPEARHLRSASTPWRELQRPCGAWGRPAPR